MGKNTIMSVWLYEQDCMVDLFAWILILVSLKYWQMVLNVLFRQAEQIIFKFKMERRGSDNPELILQGFSIQINLNFSQI